MQRKFCVVVGERTIKVSFELRVPYHTGNPGLELNHYTCTAYFNKTDYLGAIGQKITCSRRLVALHCRNQILSPHKYAETSAVVSKRRREQGD